MCDKLNASSNKVLQLISEANLKTMSVDEMATLASSLAPNFIGLIKIPMLEGEERKEAIERDHLCLHIIMDIENRCHQIVSAEQQRVHDIASAKENDLPEDEFKVVIEQLGNEFVEFQYDLRKQESILLAEMIKLLPAEDVRSVMEVFGDMSRMHERQKMQSMEGMTGLGGLGELLGQMMEADEAGVDESELAGVVQVDKDTDLNTIERAANQAEH